MTTRLVVTNSEFGTFRTCRRKWELRYEQRLRPIRVARPLRTGTLWHAGVGAMYLLIQRTAVLEPLLKTMSKDEFEESARLAAIDATMKLHVDSFNLLVDDEERDEATAALHEAVPAVTRFVTHFAYDDLKRYEVVAVEQTFHVPLVNDDGNDRGLVTIAGQWDVVLRDREMDMQLVLGENKSTAGDAHTLDLKSDIDPQLRTYLYALARHYGELAGRVLYNVARKKGPRQPSINKDESVSAAAVDTTYEIYSAALAEQKKKDISDKQAARLASLPKGTDRYTYRHEMFVTPDEIETWRRDAYGDARLIRLVRRGIIPASRNGASCRPANAYDCSYRPVCERLDPGVADGIFEVVEHRHTELNEKGDDDGEEKEASEAV